MENIRKIKKYIEKYQNIHLLMSPDLKKDSCPACLALFYSLKNLGKNATLLNKTCSEKYRFLVEKEKTHPQQADFLISIKEAGTKLSKLFYEKTDQGLNLFLKTDGELRKENISFRPLHEENLLITIGVENLKEVQKFLIGKSYTALNIDNSLKNEEFAELNFIQPEKTLSEIVFDIISHIDENLFTPSVTTCLLAGLIEQATKADKLSQASLKIIDTMIEKGADLKKVSSSLFSDNSLRILSKILGKIKAEKETGFILLKNLTLQKQTPLRTI